VFAVDPGARADAAPERPTYRTVVVFGDTQTLVDGPFDADRPLEIDDALHAQDYAYFAAMVRWVIDHREQENIDFVLHVGDIIQRGGALPLRKVCLVNGRCDRRVQWKEGKNCFCAAREAARVEWQRFDHQWSHFDGVVPYAIVRGNHDNVGVDPEGPLDSPGFAQHFGRERLSRLPGYLTGSNGRDESHAWRFALGGRPVLVLGLADSSLRRNSEERGWAARLLDSPEHAGVPAIVLAHRFYAGVPVNYERPYPNWTEVVQPRPGRVFMAVWGHVSPGAVSIVDPDAPLLRLRSNWQAWIHGEAGAFVHLVRFWLDEQGIREVQVEPFSPVVESSSIPALARQPFRVPLPVR